MAHQLLELVRLVLLVQRLILQHRQRLLIQRVGYHDGSKTAKDTGGLVWKKGGGRTAQARSKSRAQGGGTGLIKAGGKERPARGRERRRSKEGLASRPQCRDTGGAKRQTCRNE